MSYARCHWSVTVFISGYANTVVTSQHVSQSYFMKEIENGGCVFILPDANTRDSLGEFESTCVNPRLDSHKLSNSPNLSLSLVFALGYINTGGHFLFLRYCQSPHLINDFLKFIFTRFFHWYHFPNGNVINLILFKFVSIFVNRANTFSIQVCAQLQNVSSRFLGVFGFSYTKRGG